MSSQVINEASSPERRAARCSRSLLCYLSKRLSSSPITDTALSYNSIEALLVSIWK